MQKNIPKITDSRIVFDEYLKIRRDRLHFENGAEHHYYTLVLPGPAVIVLPVSPDGSFLLNEEYRHTVRKYLLSCPGGYLDEAIETPEEGARRELSEEMGCEAEKFQVLGSSYPYPGISEQKVYYVAAFGAVRTHEPDPETCEIFRPVKMTLTEVLAAVNQNGVAIDGLLCSALFLYQFRPF